MEERWISWWDERWTPWREEWWPSWWEEWWPAQSNLGSPKQNILVLQDGIFFLQNGILDLGDDTLVKNGWVWYHFILATWMLFNEKLFNFLLYSLFVLYFITWSMVGETVVLQPILQWHKHRLGWHLGKDNTIQGRILAYTEIFIQKGCFFFNNTQQGYSLGHSKEPYSRRRSACKTISWVWYSLFS